MKRKNKIKDINEYRANKKNIYKRRMIKNYKVGYQVRVCSKCLLYNFCVHVWI
ncbi:hypothetical protein LEQ06_15890 [Paraclostridium sp. AKS46]|nr:hypothetical protein [Paraclostridium sp. AKS46]